MAATPSVMVSLGTPAPGFSLVNTVSNEKLELADVKGKVATVVMFISNHCPYVKLLNTELVKVANEFIGQGVGFVAISSNDATQYPDDGPVQMNEVARTLHYPFPYLYDETQEVARAYDAACTPDFFVYDSQLKLVYRGQFDDARPGNHLVPTGRDLRNALQLMVAGKPVTAEQRPSVGCNIKWKK